MTETSQALLHTFIHIFKTREARSRNFQSMLDGRKMMSDGSQRGARGLLMFMHHEGDGLTNGEIAKLLSISPPSVSIMIKQLEEEGYVHRIRDDEDGRVQRVYLTEDGQKIIKDTKKSINEASEKLFDPLTDSEQEDLLRLMKKLEVSDIYNIGSCSRK
jgi:Transcriptional regulators